MVAMPSCYSTQLLSVDTDMPLCCYAAYALNVLCVVGQQDLCPIAHADSTFIPALFVAAKGDEIIRPHHSQQLHDAYAGDKNIVRDSEICSIDTVIAGY
jgi:hypothetical protein